MTDRKSEEMAKLAYHALEEKKAEDIRLISIEKISVIADYFLIASGANRNQVLALADSVEEALTKAGYTLKQSEGYQSASWILQDYGLDYAGTWGVGLQIRDMSFVEDLKHTFRVAYWGGTNSTSMVKYMNNAYSWTEGLENGNGAGPYLTTNDGLVEFNLVNNYHMYENFDVNLEADYVVNCMDHSTWKKARNGGTFEKQDM